MVFFYKSQLTNFHSHISLKIREQTFPDDVICIKFIYRNMYDKFVSTKKKIFLQQRME